MKNNSSKVTETESKVVELSSVEKKEPVESKNDEIINISYSKYNKFIFKTSNINSFDKKQNNIYNTIKYLLALSLGIFLILSLWMTTIWQQNIDIKYNPAGEEIRTFQGTLMHLGINLNGMYGLLNPGDIPPNMQEILDKMNGESIINFNLPLLNSAWLNSISPLAFISLVFIVPVLLFKNGTLFSTISISIGTLLLIALLIVFSIGMGSQSELVSLGRQGNYLVSLKVLDADQTLELQSIYDKIVAIVG